MTRLIDVDKLKQYIDDCKCCEKCNMISFRCDDYCELPDCVTPQWERVLNEQPTVDAVPIEVIERYREKLIRSRDMFQPHTMQWESVDEDICVVDEILKYSQKGKNDATD